MNLPHLKKTDWTPGDYWHIGPVYIQKWLFLTLLCAGSALALGILGPPSLLSPASAAPPVYRYDDPALQSVSGVVQIQDDAGRVRYVGEVAQGTFTGTGRIYDDAGHLCYDGPLVDGICQGEDAMVYRNGQLIYSGAMAANRYEGYGRRTDPETGVVSEGQFSRDMLEGTGSQYAADGTLLRKGTFSRDLLDGPGKEYSDTGVLLREGTFSQGLLDGQGKAYSADGSLVYEGTFQRGLYHGTGTLYDPQRQCLCYQGTFTEGFATGQGRLYHPSGQLLYEGAVYAASPRADAFLSLSLSEVEEAFSQHWQLYIWEDVSAFVYPYFHLMFITTSPLNIASLSADAQQTGSGGEMLSWETDKSSVIITQVLSYGQTLPGVPQPDLAQPPTLRAPGWQEWFSSYAMGHDPLGAAVTQNRQFLFHFTKTEHAAQTDTAQSLSADESLRIVTAWSTDKEGGIWYQTAQWRETS